MKKIDFTATTGKKFVNTLSKGYQGYFGMGKVRADLSKVVANNKSAMESDKARLESLGDDTAHKDYERFTLNLADSTARYERTKAKFDKLIAVERDRIDGAKALFESDELYTAYKEYVLSDGEESAFTEALAAIFVANGLTDANSENVAPYIRTIGAGKANAYRDKSVLKALNKSAFADMVARTVIMALLNCGVIDTTKYAYYEKPAKAEKSAK